MAGKTSQTRRKTDDDGGSGAGDAWLDGYLPYLIYRVSTRLNQRLQRRLRNEGINPSKWRVMSVLRSHGTLSLGQIVEATLIEQPTVSRVVAQLEKERLLSRRISQSDTRVSELSLTRKGEECLDAIRPGAFKNQQQATANFSKNELSQLREMLQRIESNIDANL